MNRTVRTSPSLPSIDVAAAEPVINAPDCICDESTGKNDPDCPGCAFWNSFDGEEYERQERLLECLPDGDYTASEMREYLA